MRRTLVLIISLLAASATMTTAATAHDYHRSRHAVERSHGGHDNKARHYKARHHKAKHRRRGRYRCNFDRGQRRYCPPRRHLQSQVARAPIWPRFVITISPDGQFRVARRYR